MHGAKYVGDDQSTCPGAGVELYVLTIRSGTNTVEGNRTLNCGVDALDCDSNDASLVV